MLNIYELCLLLRVMPKPELKSALKRIADTIFTEGGVIRKLENLGTRDLPYKMSVHGMVYRTASHFLWELHLPPTSIKSMLDEYNRDVDIIRHSLFKKKLVEPFQCTITEEILPPPYRKDVQDLVRKARSLDKPKFKYNSGLEYYPFQK